MTTKVSSQSAAKTPAWPSQQGAWTYADYARLPDNGFRYEVILGELYMTPAPGTGHQDVVTSLVSEIYHFSKQHNRGKVYASPIDVKIANLLRGQAYALLDSFGPDEQLRSERLVGFTASVSEICPQQK